MNRDDIVHMAWMAGFAVFDKKIFAESEIGPAHALCTEALNRFADLVATHIRETEFKPDWNNYRQGMADGAAEERKACAFRARIALLGADQELINSVVQAIETKEQA